MSNNLFSNVMGSCSMMLASLYIWYKLLGKKIDFKDYKVYFAFLSTVSFILLNYYYSNFFIKILVATFVLMICNKIIFKVNNEQVVVSTIIGQLIINISDIIFLLILVFVFRMDSSYISSNIFGTLLGNIGVALIAILICNLKFILSMYNKLVTVTSKIKFFDLIFFGSLLIITVNLVFAFVYYDGNYIFSIVVNIILLLIYFYIIYRAINEKSNNAVIKAENESLLDSLHQYEEMVDRQRVDNHENKNQLLIIKNMIKKKDKDVVKYIDTIVKDHMEDDEVLYTRVMTIPSGGLQGIIYQKMLVMKDEHIKFSLDVGRGVRDFDLSKLSMNDNYRLCKIIGVFLDNAIEESRKIEDRCIMISLFVDEADLVIEVSNKFEGKIDVDRLDESGYTTKGDGHGYGLPLVKKILSETDKFENERSIKRNIFKQVIKIKNT